jgi:hypothetical protein
VVALSYYFTAWCAYRPVFGCLLLPRLPGQAPLQILWHTRPGRSMGDDGRSIRIFPAIHCPLFVQADAASRRSSTQILGISHAF